ncbi:unnamed protein product [Dovyalis caffra]|uniref:Uncharacterized protein n=1 Tax=Dovyalis caffra TaxID=77055 RepID=A0AAV1QVF9_9ROSI|nr:unnamed protein product [Dovyalis caffra]
MGDKDLRSTSKEIENPCEDLVIDVPDDLQTTLRPEICICHVPVNLRRLNEDAYTPRQISIGPIHHEKENLKGMETQKRRYFKEFCNRLPKEKLKMFRKDLESAVKGCEVRIRNYYQDEAFKNFKDPKVFPNMIPNMILWDAVFIFELFLKTREYKRDQNRSQHKYKYDFILGKPWLTAAIQRDLILLENQLPFSILDELYRVAAKHVHIEADCSSFLKLSCQYFENYKKRRSDPNDTLHFTDLVRFFWSCKHPEPNSVKTIKNLYRATRLHQAGLKLKPLQNQCLLDITLRKGELHVPCFEIEDNTECILRNLMALEQCYYPDEAYICHYVKFLDFLVDVGEDADLLIKSEVIVNRLGESAAVAELLNKLCLEIVEVSSCYYDLATKLNAHSDSCWNQCWAYFRRTYFKNVWIGTGTVVGFIVLFITLFKFIQSFTRSSQGSIASVTSVEFPFSM